MNRTDKIGLAVWLIGGGIVLLICFYLLEVLR